MVQRKLPRRWGGLITYILFLLQGKRTEALEIMSVFTEMDVPQDPLSQHRYFKACIALSRHVDV
jgi:hypothetical protein